MSQVAEGACSLFHVLQGYRLESSDAELLDRIRPHRGAVDHRTPQVLVGDAPGTGEVRHESAGKGVAGTGGIEDILERKGGDIERARLSDEEGPVLPLLDHDPARASSEDPFPGAMNVPVAAQLAGFTVVDHENVDPAEEVEQRRLLALDPVVHGVAHDHLGPRHLREHAELELGVDVAEEHEFRRPELFPAAWAEVGEDPAASPTSRDSEDRRSICLPAKLSPSTCSTPDSRSARSHPLQLGERIVPAHYPDDLHRMEDGAGDAEVDGRASERIRLVSRTE